MFQTTNQTCMNIDDLYDPYDPYDPFTVTLQHFWSPLRDLSQPTGANPWTNDTSAKGGEWKGI